MAGYQRPPAVGTDEIFEAAADALASGGDPPAPLDRLWDGLEAFAAYGGELEPATLAAAATQASASRPTPAASSTTRHGRRVGAHRTRLSIIDRRLEQLRV